MNHTAVGRKSNTAAKVYFIPQQARKTFFSEQGADIVLSICLHQYLLLMCVFVYVRVHKHIRINILVCCLGLCWYEACSFPDKAQWWRLRLYSGREEPSPHHQVCGKGLPSWGEKTPDPDFFWRENQHLNYDVKSCQTNHVLVLLNCEISFTYDSCQFNRLCISQRYNV